MSYYLVDTTASGWNAKMKDFTIDGPNGKIGVLTAGGGPPLVLVAGLGSTPRIWGDLPAVLGTRVTGICPDNRGVGGSRGGRRFMLTRAAGRIVTVLDQLRLDRSALPGVTMSGAICLLSFLEARS